MSNGLTGPAYRKPDPDEKTPLQSKKFVAFLIAEITWKVVLGGLLFMGIRQGAIDFFIGSIAMAVIIIAGAIEALYIGGQAALDRYARVAQIAAGAGQSFEMKGVKSTNGHKPPPPPPSKKRDTDPVQPLPSAIPEQDLGNGEG